MKITKENNELVIRMPMEQNSYDAIGELIGKVPFIIGVINKKKNVEYNEDNSEFGFSYLIDLGYKGTQDEGEMFLHYNGEEEDFIKLCNELGISIWENPCCEYCGKTIYDSFTMDSKGYKCWDCEKRYENEQKNI